jgi:hypothetical protein
LSVRAASYCTAWAGMGIRNGRRPCISTNDSRGPEAG